MDHRGLLRFSTAGSVDDGKSTMIGRLLYDAKSIFEDQLANLVRTTARRGGVGGNAASDLPVDLALLTDGLIAEREQGITIDVAYRYFATPRRKFIIADTPGHEQYTRNMVTGASTADLTIILVDAQKGILPQSRRHALIASLLGIRHIVVAINKMDLVDWSEERFELLRREFMALTSHLHLRHLSFLPMSALLGDMVVTRGDHLAWFEGQTLLEHLETADLDDAPDARFRFPVQLVSRPGVAGAYTRGYMGRIESGRVRVGDQVSVQPSGRSARVAGIVNFDGTLDEALVPQSVTLLLDSELDISRGDLISLAGSTARETRDFDAMLCWMDGEALDERRSYVIQHTTRTVKGAIESVEPVLDVATLEPGADVVPMGLNDIGRVRVRTRDVLMLDSYAENRTMGGFVVIDELTQRTVAAGMVLDPTAKGVAHA